MVDMKYIKVGSNSPEDNNNVYHIKNNIKKVRFPKNVPDHISYLLGGTIGLSIK